MGKIVLSTVREEKPLGTNYRNGHIRRPNYRPVLQYSYSIGGKTYTGGHRVPNDDLIAFGSPQKAKAALEKCPLNQTVQVYYDPTNPGNAVLEPGKANPAWRGLTSGILCLLLILIPIWMAIAIVTRQSH
jgi:hypothetical protein